MKRENLLLVLWLLFGFIFIKAVDSTLYFIINTIYILELELDSSYLFVKYSMPLITFALYLFTTLLLLKKIRTTSNSEGIYLTKFPTKNFIILISTAILLIPLTHKISGLYAERSYRLENFSNFSELLEVYGLMHLGIGVSRWIIIIGLVVLFLRKYKHLE